MPSPEAILKNEVDVVTREMREAAERLEELLHLEGLESAEHPCLRQKAKHAAKMIRQHASGISNEVFPPQALCSVCKEWKPEKEVKPTGPAGYTVWVCKECRA